MSNQNTGEAETLQQHTQEHLDNEMEEIDLTPYEDDDDETLHRKLVLAK
jgi:hypothetical protein